jgi:hypothetical protein
MLATRRFDAHCHLFAIDYLVLEAGNMLWDAIRGRYPRMRVAGRRELEAGGPRTIREFLRWLYELGDAERRRGG